MVFPVVMYGCESWNINKIELHRTDAFELWCCRRLLRFPWTARRSSQSIQKEISPEYSFEWLMLKLKCQYLATCFEKTDSLEKTLVLEKIELRRRRDLSRMRWLHSITDSRDMSLTRFRGLVMDRESWRAAVHGVAQSQTRLSDWIVWVPDQSLNFLHSSYSGLVALLLQYWDLSSVNQQLGEKNTSIKSHQRINCKYTHS